ncbi:MAG: heme NO-binding domain-containing protein [Candidatus Omnitrophica bacterium]|nr:heme NO-binding domain-containing protein [Candidatus Omnitrophota bacterium]MBU4477662.1 heme NO-binding domain-containing protein [Candidatus Omnitrophota bacterium]MCG2703153.1 heme NO-binding domain-containing protein [Candidatus Omnitrophota bacterium]
MKGVIAKCLGELVENKFGKDKWEASLKEAGLPSETTFLSTQNLDDQAVIKVVQAVCNQLNITLPQAADAFGEYFVCEFAPKIYAAYYRGKNNARELIMAMDDIHEKATMTIPDAHPPRFTYEWKDNKTLIMHYKSHRGLIDFMVGLIKGVGKYYKENLQVKKLGDDKAEIVFV